MKRIYSNLWYCIMGDFLGGNCNSALLGPKVCEMDSLDVDWRLTVAGWREVGFLTVTHISDASQSGVWSVTSCQIISTDASSFSSNHSIESGGLGTEAVGDETKSGISKWQLGEVDNNSLNRFNEIVLSPKNGCFTSAIHLFLRSHISAGELYSFSFTDFSNR